MWETCLQNNVVSALDLHTDLILKHTREILSKSSPGRLNRQEWVEHFSRPAQQIWIKEKERSNKFSFPCFWQQQKEKQKETLLFRLFSFPFPC